MSDKYYIEMDEESTYPDSSSPHFYQDKPFDTLEAAKKWALENQSNSYGGQTVYLCTNNVLIPILYRSYGQILWEEYNDVNWYGTASNHYGEPREYYIVYASNNNPSSMISSETFTKYADAKKWYDDHLGYEWVYINRTIPGTTDVIVLRNKDVPTH